MQTQEQPTPARTILVVDDDEATRTFEEDLLLLAGYTVRKVASGAAALASVVAAPIDVILPDYWLPATGGVTLCRRLQEYIAADVPIIIITADHTPGIEGLARDAGATGLLLKPFLAAELARSAAAPDLNSRAMQRGCAASGAEDVDRPHRPHGTACHARRHAPDQSHRSRCPSEVLTTRRRASVSSDC